MASPATSFALGAPPGPEVAHHLRALAAAGRGRLEHRPPADRYAEIMRF
ncbi:hypothetical protein [Geminicoccus harenae]|nr:hypothetical protein [Geminicoccus harenae]